MTTDHDVRDAILDSALEQELRGERPPDLTERVLAATHGTTRERTRTSRWLTAALVLLGLGLVAWVWTNSDRDDDREAHPQEAPGPVPFHEDLVIPDSADHALRLIDGSARLAARVWAVRDPDSGRLVPIVEHPFEGLANLFGRALPGALVEADAHQKAAWTSLVRGTIAGPAETELPWFAAPLHLEFEVDGGTLVVCVEDAAGRSTLTILGMPLSWQLASGNSLPHLLRSILDEPSAHAVEARGIALGVGALDRLPADASSIRAYSFAPADLARLSRFTELTRLDLTGSPDAMTPEAVSHLRACTGVRTLRLPGHGLGARHLEHVVAMPALDELFVGASVWDVALGRDVMESPSNAIDDECASILARSDRLTELSLLVATRITDRGIASLASLRRLKTLAIGSTELTGRGFAAFADSPIELLVLFGCAGLDQPGARAVGDAATHVVLGDVSLSPVGVSALLEGRAIEELGIVSTKADADPRAMLLAIARADRLKQLDLSWPDFDLADLFALEGSRSLRRVSVMLRAGATRDPGLEERLRAALPDVTFDINVFPMLR